MVLHHVGIVVKDLATAAKAYESRFGSIPNTDVIHDPLQKVRAQFLRDENGRLLELIEPDGPDSPVWRDAQKGGGLNHLCYETSDLDKTIEESTAEGAMVVRPIAPGVAFEGRRIVFLYFLDLGLIEFVESAKA
jgi:methylmalonyl-CoA/ethylmalonyl-CoA epimerase